MKRPRTILRSLCAGLGLALVALGLWVAAARISRQVDDTWDSSKESGRRSAAADRASVDRLAASTRDTFRFAQGPAVSQRLITGLALIRAEADSSKQEELFDQLAREVSASELPDAVELLLGAQTIQPGQDMGLRLLRRWAEGDPRAAAAWLDRGLADATPREAIKSVATVWASRDFAEATKWVRQLPDAEVRRIGLVAVAYEAARTQPDVALGLAQELPASAERKDLVTHLASQWATRSPDAAAAWALKIEDPSVRDGVLAGIAVIWGESDPLAAASLAISSLEPGRLQNDAVIGIVQRWVQNAPADAAAWVTGFPEGGVRDTAMENVVKLWPDQDPNGVAAWLTGLAPGPSRDFAIGAYVTKVAAALPEMAVQWAESIADEAMRQSQMKQVVVDWLVRDEAGARSWIAQSPLTESVRTRLLEPQKE